MIQDQFRGRTWIYWAQLLGCGIIGSFSVIFGTLFWIGAITDAREQPRPQAGPPMVIIGAGLLAVACLAIFNIVSRFTPIIRCSKEGIECKLIGISSLDGLPLPGLFRIAWTIASLQGFRSQRVRLNWLQFNGAYVSGLPMAYVLSLRGVAVNSKTGIVSDSITFPQVALKDHPQRVADALNQFAAEPTQRDPLPSFPVAEPSETVRVERFSG